MAIVLKDFSLRHFHTCHKAFAEVIDGPSIKILLGILDGLASKYIPIEYHAALREAINGFLAS